MSKRLDACTPRKNGDRTFWLKVGSAWQNEKGIQVVLDALPLPDAEGRCVINLFEPKPREDRGQSSRAQSSNDGWGRDDDPAF